MGASTNPESNPTVTAQVDRIVTGGRGLAHLPDGRVLFVRGALPGETVTAAVTKEAKRHAEADVVSVLARSPNRQTPPCRHVARGCGGCDWQHAAPDFQRELRRDIVQESLRRIAKIDVANVISAPELPTEGYRTTLRCAVSEGRAGFRAASSHDVIPVGSCLVAHPLAAELLTEGRYGKAEEVTIRVSEATGERVVLVKGSAKGVVVPSDVRIAEMASSDDQAIHEDVLGHRFRVSARSFFQSGPSAAAALAQAASRAMEDVPDGPLVDAYGGIGLFARLCGEGRDVTVVENGRSATQDASVNLDRCDHLGQVTVVRSDVKDWDPTPAAVIVADPARKGVGAAAVQTLAATEAPRFVLISCDPAAMATDARLLSDVGYELRGVEVLDVFGHTSHVETVSRFDRRQ